LKVTTYNATTDELLRSIRKLVLEDISRVVIRLSQNFFYDFIDIIPIGGKSRISTHLDIELDSLRMNSVIARDVSVKASEGSVTIADSLIV
jgi:hypothetical protein